MIKAAALFASVLIPQSGYPLPLSVTWTDCSRICIIETGSSEVYIHSKQPVQIWQKPAHVSQ